MSRAPSGRSAPDRPASILDDAVRKKDLARRLTVALVVPVALLLAVGAVLGLQIFRMNEDVRWVDLSDRVVGETQALRLELMEQESAMRGFLLTGDAKYADDYARAKPFDQIADLRMLVSGNPAQQTQLDVVRVRYERLTEAYGEVFRRQRSAELATPEQIGTRRAYRDEVRAAIDAFEAVENQLRRDRQTTARESTETTRVVYVVLFLLAAGSVAFASRRQLGALAQTFASVLDAERATRAALEDQDWVRAGLVRLSEQTQGERPVEQLAHRILGALATYVGADVGALFTSEGASWKRRAAFGIDPAGAPTTFSTGEGLLGRALAESRTVRVKGVPPGHLKLASGTGSSDPCELVAFPALAEGAPHAVIELGFFQEARERAIDLCERASEAIALTVRSAEHRARLRELLEESQRQAEELRTQQEELRVTNEELEEQRNALRVAHAQVEERQEELQAINARLEEQALDLSRARDALAAKAKDAVRANRYKSEFLANMSHELRTPLNSSLILAKLLADNKDGNLTEEQVGFARTIYGAGNDLLALINDILDLAKIEAGKLEVKLAPVKVSRLAEALQRTFEPLAQEKKLELSISASAGLEGLVTDGQRVEQILRNLLSNAIKFTDRGAVMLTISARGSSFVFEVRDTGIGIPADQHEAVFEAFRQVDGSESRRHGGTGLGLSISRDLARMLGGDIAVTSEPGKGSVFTLTLPDRSEEEDRGRGRIASDSEPPPSPRRPARGQENGRPRIVPLRGPSFPDDRDRRDPSQSLVLVVEDDVAFAKILLDLAHELGFQCVVAHEADEGFALAVQHRPQAVLLDVELPDHSGLSVLDRLKRSSDTRHIPVHVVSVADHAQAALSMGAVGYLHKPVDREQLADTFRHIETRLARRMRRLLVVEDNAVQRASLERLLGGRDIETVGAGSVKDALAALSKSSTFDCVVLDLALPDGTGFDLLDRMASDTGYSFPPVVVYTGRSLSPEEEQRLRRYSSSIIIKGARSPERLLDEVTLFLHRVESELPTDQQKMLKLARDREAVFENRQILVVEDDVRNIFALSSVLEPKGAKVVIARNGREALDVLEKTPGIDLVLMDIMMPEMDGLEATRAVRKRPEWARLPIIALTAKAMRDDQEKCRDAGANDYVSKPLDVDKLLSLLRVWMPK